MRMMCATPYDTAIMLDRKYRTTGPFQVLRELAMNSLQARSTRIEFGFDEQHYNQYHEWRLTCADNGHGMDGRTLPKGNQLRDFFLQYGNSGRPFGPKDDANFGIGAKVCTLPWTDLAILSWTPETPEGYGIIIESHGEHPTKVYRPREFIYPDGSIDDVFVVEGDEHFGHLKPSWVTDHGTVVVLLGRGQYRNTLFLDGHWSQVGREEGRANFLRTMGASLDQRFMRLPPDVQMRVVTFEVGDEQLFDPTKAPFKKHMRNIRGVDQRLAEHTDRLMDSGTVHGLPHGFKVHWRLWQPIDAKKQKRLNDALSRARDDPAEQSRIYTKMTKSPDYYMYPNKGKAFVVNAHCSRGTADLYELMQYRTHREKLAKWGLIGPMQRQVGLIVEGPRWDPATSTGVYPDETRSYLMFKGAREAGQIPEDELARYFAANLPAPLAKLRQEAFRNLSDNEQQRWQRLLRRLQKYLSREVKSLDADGTDTHGVGAPVPSHGASSDTPRRKKRPRKLSTPSGSRTQTPRHILPIYPVVRMACDFDPPHVEEDAYYVRWQGPQADGTELWIINDQDERFAIDAETLLAGYPQDLQDAARARVIYPYYRELLASQVVAIYARENDKDPGRPKLTRAEIEDMVRDEKILTLMLHNPLRDETTLRAEIEKLRRHT